MSVYRLQLLGYELLFRKYTHPVEIKKRIWRCDLRGPGSRSVLDSPRICIRYCTSRRNVCRRSQRRVIYDREDHKKIDATSYKFEDRTRIKNTISHLKFSALSLKSKSMGKRSSASLPCCHYFPPPKRNGDEFIILDTCSGVNCFNRLKLYDIID